MSAFNSVSDVIQRYLAVLEAEGPAGLQFLNERVPHRYSAVYRLEGGTLRNEFVFDKLGQLTPEFLQVVPLGDSFCQFVLREGIFQTTNTSIDARLLGHKYQGVVGSYHGLPLVDNFGELYGTICHFDIDAHDLSDHEFAVLKQAAKVLPRYLGRTRTAS
ncbi:guanylate cyclase [Acidovorax sp. LjRoot129]|uniref:guanylate cyclase n=1 Tax=Acidovorax sp. LjRoot129 TaxID=3342260 RepID=UPI003ECF875C